MKAPYRLEKLNKENLFEVFKYEVEEDFTIEDIINKKSLESIGLEYAIIYNFDSVITKKIKDIDIDLDNIMEARFFNEEKEIRLFRDEDKLNITIFDEEGYSDYISSSYILYPRHGEKIYFNKLDIKKYIDYEKEDNQAYIRYVKASKLYFEEEKR